MCEAFSCTPEVAEQELDRDAELVFEILELRAYANAKREFDRIGDLSPKHRAEVLSDPLVKVVMQIEEELIKADGAAAHN